MLPARAPDDEELDAPHVGTESTQGLHRQIEPLQRLHPPDEQQDRFTAETQGHPGALGIAGREQGVLDARRDDLDPVGRCFVQADELLGLRRSRGADHVRARHHLLLGTGAPR